MIINRIHHITELQLQQEIQQAVTEATATLRQALIAVDDIAAQHVGGDAARTISQIVYEANKTFVWR